MWYQQKSAVTGPAPCRRRGGVGGCTKNTETRVQYVGLRTLAEKGAWWPRDEHGYRGRRIAWVGGGRCAEAHRTQGLRDPRNSTAATFNVDFAPSTRGTPTAARMRSINPLRTPSPMFLMCVGLVFAPASAVHVCLGLDAPAVIKKLLKNNHANT